MGQYAVRSKSVAEIAVPLAGMHSRLVKLQGKVIVWAANLTLFVLLYFC